MAPLYLTQEVQSHLLQEPLLFASMLIIPEQHQDFSLVGPQEELQRPRQVSHPLQRVSALIHPSNL